MAIEENNNFEENDIFSKYIARNFLGSLMKGLAVPKRKIDRDINREVQIIYDDEPKEPKKTVRFLEKNETKEENEIYEEPQNDIIEQEGPELSSYLDQVGGK